MELARIEELLREFDRESDCCGDVEYIHLQHIRCDLAEYIAALKKYGTGELRQGYVETQLT